MAWLQGLWWDGKFFLNQLIYTELSPEFGKVICSLVKTGPATFFLSFRLTWTQANFIFCCILVSFRSMMWYFTSPYEQHIPRSSYWPFTLHNSRCFIQEHIFHGDKWFEDKRSVCPTFKFPALLSYRNIFNHFAFLTPFPPSYWSYHGSNPALTEG